MAKHFKKALSAFLALLMCVSTFAPAVMANEATNTWLGDDVYLNFQAGEDPFVYAIAQDAANNRWYYETSNHTVKKEVTGGGAVHIFPIVDTTKVTDEWTPDGIYESGVSNYDVMYCCDATTGTDGEIYYKRVNLEDSEYVSNTDAKRLRAIVENAYPYVSVEEAKAALKEAGFVQADELDRSELISATQAAIWKIANPKSGDSYYYSQTASDAKKVTWGGFLHDFSSESNKFDAVNGFNKWGYKSDEDVKNRVNDLIDFYLALPGVEAEATQIVISNLEIVESVPVVENDELYSVILNVELNNSGNSAEDDIKLDVYVGDTLFTSEKIKLGDVEYTVSVNAKAGETIKAVVSGTQKLGRGVYFYAPMPQDVDGDGIATSREVSQNLIGVAAGETPVHAEDEVTLVVGSVTGAVTLQKVDDKGNALAGAEFDLYAEVDGEMVFVKSLEVGETGSLYVGELQIGAYELKETKAPVGYEALEEPIRFYITKNGAIHLLVEGGASVEIGHTSTEFKTESGEIAVGEELPKVILQLITGENTDAEISLTVGNETIDRKASAETSAVETIVNTSSTGETKAVAPVYDVIDGVKEDKGGMFDYQFNSGLTSKYSNPETWTDMPADADVRYVGTGEHSKYYVYAAYVEYEKDDNGNAKVDENGNFIIKQLRRNDDVNSPSLTIDGEVTTQLITELGLESEYDNPGGSRPFLFVMKDRQGQAYYGYCCDLDTPANDGFYYTIANLEDSNYYGSDESEAHIRSIVMNGYWGTTGIPAEDGSYAFGSLELLKQKLIAYLDANPELNTSLTAPVLDRNNKYQPVVDENEKVATATKTMKEMVEGLTSGEALLATQAAIWSYANGSYNVLNGKDGSIVLDPDGYKWNHDAMGNSKTAGGYTNGEAMDDFASTAVDFLYTWLINLDTEEESTVVINDKNFVENVALEIGNKVAENTYLVDVSFELGFVPGEKDDLKIELTYGEQTFSADLNTITVVNGRYVIKGIKLTENEANELTLRLVGKQYLEHGTYVYLAHGGRENSQNFVGVAEGEKNVDVSKSISFTFEVEESKTIEKVLTSVEETLIVVNTPIAVPPLEGDKTSTGIFDNRFEISIEVPGGDAEVKHDEVILMVDGSYSMDNEWPAMKEAITTIGEAVLDGSGHTQLTLMAFGMGDNEVLVHVKTVDELAAVLGELPGTLLYGRSSTNCEAGFTGVAEYIANHDETLGKVDVIFISDGNLNTDETPRAFDANWQTWTKFGALGVAQEAFGGTVSNGANLPAAFTTVFGNRFDGATREEIISRAFGGEVTDEEFIAFAEQLWTDVYAYSGLTRGVAYPVSDAERAFVKYDKENGTYIQDLFYYTTYKSAYVTYGNRWTRTPAAADALAAMDEVKALYVVDYDGYTSWMDTGITSEKSTFVQSNGIVGLIEALKETLSELALTPYNDVVITDYMSKWVNIDLDTLHIVDNKTGETIWTAAEGWLIAEELRPTAQDVPVDVKLVERAGYAAGGPDVAGNASGDIYLLTWYVKDGALLRSDNYKLVYEVEVDTAEYGFKYGVDYPANGFTDLHYIDVNGDDQTNKIKVPNIISITGTVTLKKVDENGKLISGAVFELYKIENGTEALIGTYKLDNGKIAIHDLAVGSYKLVETKAPKGYIGIDEPMYFEIIRNKSGKLEVKSAYELEFPATAYEISNHITSVAIPQTFVILDAENAKNWTYSGEFVFGESNYDVVYCADSETGVVDGTKYYRVDLADIFGEEAAAKLRAIVANSYPYVSVADMIAAAAAANVADAENLTRGDIIAAVQLAIWHYTNGIEDYTYKATYSVEAYPHWGKVFNDYSDELIDTLPNGESNTKRVVDEASEARIRALYNYLLALESDTECDTDVFVYVPQGGKDVSQMLIGGTRTNFYTNGMEISVVNVAEKVTVPPTITFKKGEASNISFMLIDKETGAVEFLKKIDIGNQTSFEIPTEEGKISAVFVKQSTSGMFWFAEEVDEATQQAVINCLKKNNPSYKGYNALCFGAGDHDLEFKKNKFVTYTFTGEVVDTVETPETEAPETEAPEAEAPETEAPETEAPETEAPEVEEPVTPPVVEEPAVKTLNYEVKGAKITSWTVVDGITAIYIKGNGKVPSVLWTSEKAKGMTLINILVELDLLDNMPEYQFDTVGAHTFHYQQNKKKTVSVTYTFIEK